MSNKADIVLVSLDALLDTRLSILKKIDSRTADLMLVNGAYFSRVSDKFPAFPGFAERYAKRDRETLRDAMVTECINFIRDMVSQMVLMGYKTPFHQEVRVQVNTYPYALEEEEIILIGEALAVNFIGVCELDMVTLNDKQISPSYCRENVTVMVMYDYKDWLDTHALELEKLGIPEVDLYVPGLYFGEEPSQAEIEAMVRERGHPMELIENAFKPMIHLDLLTPRVFSVLNHLNIKSA